jgi:hypothetical protein
VLSIPEPVRHRERREGAPSVHQDTDKVRHPYCDPRSANLDVAIWLIARLRVETFGTMDCLASGLIHGLMFVSWTIHASLSVSVPFLSTRLVSAHAAAAFPLTCRRGFVSSTLAVFLIRV